jgi:uncharacterized protein (TIGR03435 family)
MTRSFASFVLGVCLIASVDGSSDVISVIKPNRSGAVAGTLGVPSAGRFGATNVTVAAVIAAAYGGLIPLDESHITGLPQWARADRFDLEARVAATEPSEDAADDAAIVAAFAMVRAMLAERVALKVHEATRNEPIYTLVRIRAARVLPPPTRDCDAIAKAGPFAGPPPGADPSAWAPCGIRVRPGELVSAGGTMAQFARRLSVIAGINRTVVDRTGLDGRVDFTLRWTPPQPTSADGSGSAAVIDAGPGIFTALREQLGLKLESSRGPVRLLVIDHIDRPTPN